jgi:hypothetical protein
MNRMGMMKSYQNGDDRPLPERSNEPLPERG